MVTTTGWLEKRDLTQLEARVLKVPEGELVGRQLFDIDDSVNPGAETYSYDVVTRSGIAKIMANGTTEVPLVNGDYERHYGPMISFALGATWTNQELRAAAMANRNVQSDKMDAVRRGLSEAENKLIFVGNEAEGIKGFTNADGINLLPAAKTFTEMTNDEILDTISSARSKLKSMPGFEQATYNMVLPTEQFEYLSNKRFNEYDSRTVLEVIESRNWFANIIATQAMAGIGANGSNCLAIVNTDKDVAQIKLALDTTLLNPENYATYSKVVAELRVGGVAVRIPYQIARVDGI